MITFEQLCEEDLNPCRCHRKTINPMGATFLVLLAN
jgi:hypothetical protein